MAYKDPEDQRRAWRRHYERNRQKYIDRAAATRAEIRQFVTDFKATHPCTDCGHYFPAICMDFDHIGDDKVYDVSRMVTMGSRRQVEEEMAKCELVCSNCHRIRTASRASQNRVHC